MAYRDSFVPFGYALTPWVKRLLIANTAIWLVAWAVSGLWVYLAFVPSDLLARPWTIVTYMFVHVSFWHLFFNMIALFFFGPPLESRWGSREFIKFYLVCGLGGAVLSLITPDAAIIGASAAVFGVMLAFAMNWPDSPIYIWGIFPIKAKWLVVILAAFALMSAVGGARDGVAHLAHLGGFAAGFLYLKLDLGNGGSALAGLRKRAGRSRMRVVSGERPSERPPARGAGRRLPAPDEEKLLDDVDRVLDKISEHGISSLSPEEKTLLDEVSKRYRKH